MSNGGENAVLYVVACAAPPVRRIHDLITAAQGRGWDTCLILTPSAGRWLNADLADLAALTGHPVRTEYKLPDQPDVLPAADAILAAPVTFNSVNKWAAGISDTLALGVITEAIGKRLPMIAVPSLNLDQQVHPAFAVSVERLRSAGVVVLLDAEGHALRGNGSDNAATYPWGLVLDSLETAVGVREVARDTPVGPT